MSWAELLEEKARHHRRKALPHLRGLEISRTARWTTTRTGSPTFLLDLGGDRGKGLAMMMGNCPQYLDVFIGLAENRHVLDPGEHVAQGRQPPVHPQPQRGGVHRDRRGIHRCLLEKLPDRVENIKHVIVNSSQGPSRHFSATMRRSTSAYRIPAKSRNGTYWKRRHLLHPVHLRHDRAAQGRGVPVREDPR